MSLLHGIIPILPTPFDDRGEVDHAGLRSLVGFLISQGVHGLGALALASEGYKLTDDERRQVLATIVEETRGRVPVVVAVYHEATRVAVDMCLDAVSRGADAIMLLPPVLGKPAGKELVQHLSSLASAAGVPVVIQDTPQVRGTALALDDYVRILDVAPNVRYAKIEALPAGQGISRLLEALGDRIEVLAGWGGLELLDALDRGACGCMPGSDVAPLLVQVYAAYRGGDKAQSHALFDGIRPLISFGSLSLDRFVIVAKTILAGRKIISSPTLRAPFTPLDSIERDEMDRLLRATHLS
jgi:4-hydroxy-tetrahydrodipicolinate synthase